MGTTVTWPDTRNRYHHGHNRYPGQQPWCWIAGETPLADQLRTTSAQTYPLTYCLGRRT